MRPSACRPGIKNYNDVCETTGVREYDEATDKGTGTSFWNGASESKSEAKEGAPKMVAQILLAPEIEEGAPKTSIC